LQDTLGGFDAIRNIYRSIQRGDLPGLSDLERLPLNLGWLTRAVWWRYVHGRLLAADDARYELHLVIEQAPAATNRITLSEEKRDMFGCPLAVIDWSVGASDLRAFAEICDLFVAEWNASNLADYGALLPRAAEDSESQLVRGGGVYHPGGSIRIGKDRQGGVVDGTLRSFAVPNLWAVTTATFPSGGGANPTLMLMLFALRVADDIKARARH
jgi:choline dehydrogenase-like flavoprotein